MATWKKVIVSGSNISQLNNDAGYVTSTTAPNAFATASVGAVNLIANSPTGSLAFASSSGQGLTISGSAGNDTLTFGLSAIPNTSLANSSVTVTAGSGLSGGGAVALGSSVTLSVNSGSMLPFFTGSVFSQVSGDITISSAGVATIATNSVALGTDTTGNYVATIANVTNGGLTVNNSGTETAAVTLALNLNDLVGGTINVAEDKYVFIDNTDSISKQASFANLATSQAGTGLTATAGTFNVNYGSSAGTAVQGNTTASINVTAGELTLDAGTAAQALGGGPSWTLGLADTITGNRTFSNNVIITGDLTVNGTATYINVADIFVEDPFILLASGSTGTSDGGIIIDRGATAAGNIGFGFDVATSRWGVQDGLTDLTTGIDLGASTNGVSGSFLPYLFVEATHGATKPVTGEFAVVGSMYMSTAGDFWIYTA